MNKFRVLKFGGTSVGAPDRMKQVVRLVTADSQPKIVVLSALSGTTNSLVSIGASWKAHQKNEVRQQIEVLYDHYLNFIGGLFDEKGQAARDIVDAHFEQINKLTQVSFNRASNKELLAQGELLSTNLCQLFLNERGIESQLMPALEVIALDEHHEPDLARISNNLKPFTQDSDCKLIITQGFICRNYLGEIDNLQRGGSDYTASLLGAAVKAECIEIWTDIDGMHNNDPRIVPNTYPIHRLSFDEAAELAYFGAKILHPNTIGPAQKHDIPVKLLNTMDPQARGTIISGDKNPGSIKAIAAKDGIIAFKIKSSRMLLAYGFLRKIFEIFEQFRVPIDMVTTSEVAVSLTIDDDEHLDQLVAALKEYGEVVVDENLSIICMVGDLLVDQKDLLSNIFQAVGDKSIRMVSYGGSRNNISMLIPTPLKSEVLRLLNQKLFEGHKVTKA